LYLERYRYSECFNYARPSSLLELIPSSYLDIMNDTHFPKHVFVHHGSTFHLDAQKAHQNNHH
jgi:hypothetical protein